MTQLDPNYETFTIEGLPQYALPDLSNKGTSWVFPITKSPGPCEVTAIDANGRRTRNNSEEPSTSSSNQINRPIGEMNIFDMQINSVSN